MLAVETMLFDSVMILTLNSVDLFSSLVASYV